MIINRVHVHEYTNEIMNAQRNIILQHHNFFVFQKNYVSKYMFNIQIVYRDLKLQIVLMRVVSDMNRTIDFH